MREIEYYWRECLILVLMLAVLATGLSMTDSFGSVGEDVIRAGLSLRAGL